MTELPLGDVAHRGVDPGHHGQNDEGHPAGPPASRPGHEEEDGHHRPHPGGEDELAGDVPSVGEHGGP